MTELFQVAPIVINVPSNDLSVHYTKPSFQFMVRYSIHGLVTTAKTLINNMILLFVIKQKHHSNSKRL